MVKLCRGDQTINRRNPINILDDHSRNIYNAKQ